MAELSGPLDHRVCKMKPILASRVYSILHRILSVYHFLACAKSTLNEDEIREANPPTTVWVQIQVKGDRHMTVTIRFAPMPAIIEAPKRTTGSVGASSSAVRDSAQTW